MVADTIVELCFKTVAIAFNSVDEIAAARALATRPHS